MARFHLSIIFLLLVNYLVLLRVQSATFTVTNKCNYTVWPGFLSGAGTAPLPTTGFALQASESKVITVPSSWSGRIWGRTQCAGDSSSGEFACATGDCKSGEVECSGQGATPPATLAEFTLNGAGGQDFYDVSLVDGYNLPMLVVPQGGTGDNCTTTGCAVDLNGACPSELKVPSGTSVKETVACNSACGAFQDAQYCCSGAYGSPNTCKPSSYSEVFKTACPRAYSYAYDDKTSTFICGSSPDYLVTFCPSPNTIQKSWTGAGGGNEPGGNNNNTSTATNKGGGTTSGTDSSMVYMGAMEISGGGRGLKSVALAGGMALMATIWQLRHFYY